MSSKPEKKKVELERLSHYIQHLGRTIQKPLPSFHQVVQH